MEETKNDFFRLPGLISLFLVPFGIVLMTVCFCESNKYSI